MTQVQDERALRGPHSGRSEPHLVGPELFPLYLVVLKIVLATVVGSALVVGVVKAVQSSGGSGEPLAIAIGIAWNGAFVAIGAVTLGFTLLQFNDGARSRISSAWAPLLQTRPIRLRRTNWFDHLAVIVAQAFFTMWWIGAVQSWRIIPLSAGQSLSLDLAPVFDGLHWPVLGLSIAVIAVNGVRLARMTNRRLDHGLDLALHLALLAVAVVALRGGYWVGVSGSGLADGAISQVDRAVNIGVLAALAVTACVAAVLAGVHARGLFQREPSPT